MNRRNSVALLVVAILNVIVLGCSITYFAFRVVETTAEIERRDRWNEQFPPAVHIKIISESFDKDGGCVRHALVIEFNNKPWLQSAPSECDRDGHMIFLKESTAP